MIYKLDFNKKLVELDGSPASEFYTDKEGETQRNKACFMWWQLANSLAMGSNAENAKFYDWAINLNKNGIIECDASDLQKITQFFKEIKSNNLVKTQMQRQLDSEVVRNDKKKEKVKK